MKINDKHIYFILLSVCIVLSCRKIYDPEVNAPGNVLVVEGLVSDELKPYQIHLTTALPYDSSGTGKYINDAKISISDDCGDVYILNGTGYGYYASDPASFTGIPGRTYTLHIETSDGNLYESSPQLMLPNDFLDTTYAEYTTRETLVENTFGEYMKVFTAGTEVYKDIKSNSETLPRFRFHSEVTTEYIFTRPVSPLKTEYHYCWVSGNPDDIVNLTDEKYASSSNDIKKHTLCFIPTIYTYQAFYTDTTTKKDTTYLGYVINRIISTIRYRLNEDAYQYYKNINSLLSADGKLFDPIAFQFKGNITCISNSQKIALGLFEVSSVEKSTCYIKIGQKDVRQSPYLLIPQSNCRVDTVPSFWIY